jgi:hypothetical protein
MEDTGATWLDEPVVVGRHPIHMIFERVYLCIGAKKDTENSYSCV